MSPARPHGLGRGLGALIPAGESLGIEPANPSAPSPTAAATEIPLERIRETNPRQPRTKFDDAALATLAESIRAHGVLQPVLVTETSEGFRLVAGERRVRAARMAGLTSVPAVIRQLADRDQLELALVENLQREDLDPIEAAKAYRQLIDEFGFSQEQLAARVSRARSTVANTLRLLELAPEVQEAVASGAISEGHARAIGGLGRERQRAVVDAVVSDDLSVRSTEELVRRLRDGGAGKAATTAAGVTPSTRPVDADMERVEEDLRRALGTKVSLARSRRGGRIVIEYYDDEDLGRLYARLIGGDA